MPTVFWIWQSLTNFFTNTVSVLLNQTVLGDVNCDGVVSLLDIEPLVDLLTANQFLAAADINQDGDVNILDVPLFVQLLLD